MLSEMIIFFSKLQNEGTTEERVIGRELYKQFRQDRKDLLKEHGKTESIIKLTEKYSHYLGE